MFWDIYSDLCAKRGLSANYVAKELSISSGTITGWKQGRVPQNATLKKIADYFGVTTEYLLEKEEKKSAPAPFYFETPDPKIRFSSGAGYSYRDHPNDYVPPALPNDKPSDLERLLLGYFRGLTLEKQFEVVKSVEQTLYKMYEDNSKK